MRRGKVVLRVLDITAGDYPPGSMAVRRDHEGSFYAVHGGNAGGVTRDGVITGAFTAGDTPPASGGDVSGSYSRHFSAFTSQLPLSFHFSAFTSQLSLLSFHFSAFAS